MIERARGFYASIGQVPVTVLKEVEGFILNRLQGALLAEAFRLVTEGYVSPQDLDRTVKDGLGLRWSFMGPFETIELNAPGGIEDYCARYTGFYKRVAAEPPRPPSMNTPPRRCCWTSGSRGATWPPACVGATAVWRPCAPTRNHSRRVRPWPRVTSSSPAP